MKRRKGIHFYINIRNFNNIILDEEAMTGNVTHSLHALDTFFSSIEKVKGILFIDSSKGIS